MYAVLAQEEGRPNLFVDINGIRTWDGIRAANQAADMFRSSFPNITYTVVQLVEV